MEKMIINKVTITAEMEHRGESGERIAIRVEDEDPVYFFPNGSIWVDNKEVRNKVVLG